MKLSDFAKSAPPVSSPGVPPSSPEPAEAEPQAPQEEQYNTTTTPSGIEIYYSWAPRRHYKLRDAGSIVDGSDMWPWREVPSVTNVLGVLDRSGPLVWWSQGIACEGVLELVKRGRLKWVDA